MVHAPGLLHIGGAAYVVWAYPPNFGCTAQRHIPVHRRTTVKYPTAADTMIETILLQISPRPASRACAGHVSFGPFSVPLYLNTIENRL
jgi:hypothetical protein